MALTTSAYWASFAKSGNPNGRGAVRRPPHNARDEALLDLTDDGPLARLNFERDKVDMWQRLRSQQFENSGQ